MLFLDFILLSFVISYFYFCFLVKVEFLTYLSANLLRRVDFIIVILEKIKPANLKFIFTVLFTH